MSVTPAHPALNKPGPLTRDEMLAAVRYEGMFGIGMPADIELARDLEREGFVHVASLHDGLCVVNCDDRCH